jgi:hypothetical protein
MHSFLSIFSFQKLASQLRIAPGLTRCPTGASTLRDRICTALATGSEGRLALMITVSVLISPHMIPTIARKNVLVAYQQNLNSPVGAP